MIVDLGEGGEFFVRNDGGQGDWEEGPHAQGVAKVGV